MGGNPSLVPRLSHWLHRMGLEGFAAALLEAGQPLAPLGAQLSYMAEPLLDGLGLPLAEVGQLLEDPRRLEALVRSLNGVEDLE